MDHSSYLRVCKSCGEDFAKSVKVCSNCGQEVQSSMILMLIIGVGCLALAAAFAIPINKDQSNDIEDIFAASADNISATELAAAINNKNSRMNPQTQNIVNEITGKIVQWDLEVFVVTKLEDSHQIVTKPTRNAPGTLLTVYPRNNRQKIYLENITPGNTIQVKGKIAGIQLGRIKINPAIVL
ncbi:MAG: hypothetical protein KJP23_02795 [Deltaproteobacteria bacterium]|nr:hypothetical protein [Deltaproteobacteria bacterium]